MITFVPDRKENGMKFLKATGVSALLLALAGGVFTGVFKYMQNAQSPRQVVKTDGAKVVVEELSFFNDMDKYYGKIYKPADTSGTHPVLIFCHGIGATADWGETYCRTAASRGFYAYAFDFRGGSPDSRSSGKTTDMSVETEKEDLLFILKRIRREPFTDRSQVFVMGHSQGGLVAALAAKEARRQIAGLVLLAPAFNIPDFSRELYPKTGKIPETTDLFGTAAGKRYFTDVRNLDPYKWLARFQQPVLLIHGDQDQTVPLSYVERAFECYGMAELEILEGAGHSFDGYADEVRERLAAWLDHRI